MSTGVRSKGSLTMVKAMFGLRRRMLAVVLALGLPGTALSVQPPLPLPARIEVSGAIYALAVQADRRTVVGGSFTSINGVARSSIGRLNTDGSVDLTWDPGAGSAYGKVYSLCATGNAIVVGGSFTTMGGKARRNLAAVGIAEGVATDWDPQADGYVNALALYGGTLFVGGGFFALDGQLRSGLAAVDAATGTLAAWNPAPNGGIETMAVAGNTLYVGGSFNSIGGGGIA